MDDVERVGTRQRTTDLAHHAHGVADRDRSVAVDSPIERLALQVLHHDVRRAVFGLAVVVDLHRETGAQLGRAFGLGVEALARFLRVGELPGDQLDGNLLAKGQVGSQPHRSHRARSELLLQAVLARDDRLGSGGCGLDHEGGAPPGKSGGPHFPAQAALPGPRDGRKIHRNGSAEKVSSRAAGRANLLLSPVSPSRQGSPRAAVGAHRGLCRLERLFAALGQPRLGHRVRCRLLPGASHGLDALLQLRRARPRGPSPMTHFSYLLRYSSHSGTPTEFSPVAAAVVPSVFSPSLFFLQAKKRHHHHGQNRQRPKPLRTNHCDPSFASERARCSKGRQASPPRQRNEREKLSPN